MTRDFKEIERRQKALALHFGLPTYEVEIPGIDDYDDEFTVSFGSDITSFAVEVVTKDTAIANERCFDSHYEESVEEIITEYAIGMYTKMIGSEYYFRWL